MKRIFILVQLTCNIDNQGEKFQPWKTIQLLLSTHFL